MLDAVRSAEPDSWSAAMSTHPQPMDQLRAKNRRQFRIILTIAFIAGGAVVVYVLAVFAVLWFEVKQVKDATRAAAAVDRATAGQEGENWTLNQLYSYLQAKGAVAEMRVVESDGSRPTEWM